MWLFVACMIVAFGTISCLFGQRVYIETRPYMGLSGFIHTVREESYNCSGDPAEKPWRVSEATYDRGAHLTYGAYYNPDGSIGHQESHTFNVAGNETGWAEFYGQRDFPPNGLHKHAIYTLSGGKPVAVIVYREDGPEFKTTFEYDERGSKLRETTVEVACPACTITRTYKYDVKNRLVENTYASNGLNSTHLLTYDGSGKVLSESSYDKGVLAWKTTHTFDGERLLEEVTAYRDGKTRITRNAYDGNGNLTLTTIEDPSILSRTVFEYSKKGTIRLKDQTTVAKPGGSPQSSEDEPTPGRIVEKYEAQGKQVERYIYDASGEVYLTQISSYDNQGRQTRLVETSRLGSQYSRDLAYAYDSYGNQVGSFCRKVNSAGDVTLLPASRRIIAYYEN